MLLEGFKEQKIVDVINLEGKDDFKFCRYSNGIKSHDFFMCIHKKDSKLNNFIHEYEFLRVKDIKMILQRQPLYKRILRRFNHTWLCNLIYERFNLSTL